MQERSWGFGGELGLVGDWVGDALVECNGVWDKSGGYSCVALPRKQACDIHTYMSKAGSLGGDRE
jgi:hypothetical protein